MSFVILKEFNNDDLNFYIDVHTDLDKNEWFKAKDLTILSGYADTDKSIRKYIDPEDKKTCPVQIGGQVRWCTFLNESGMYSLIMQSKLPRAKKFK